MPDSSRIVVPELPASSGAGGGREASQSAAFDLDMSPGLRPRSCRRTATPSACRQASVERQSAPVR